MVRNMKFDNVTATVAEARRIELPFGKGVIGFLAKYTDTRSTSYLRTRTKLSKPYRKLIDAEALPADKDREIAVRVFVREALIGWDGITSDGRPVPFTEDNAVDFLVQAPKVFYDLLDEAGERNNFLPSEDDAKNSETV